MVFVPASDNRWVDENYARLAELVQNYDPYLELRWIPPEHRTKDDKKPYVIIDTRIEKPVLFADELEQPHEILARVMEADNKYGNVLDRLELRNTALEMFRLQEHNEKLAEASDKALFMVKSPINFLKMDGKKWDDQRRVIS